MDARHGTKQAGHEGDDNPRYTKTVSFHGKAILYRESILFMDRLAWQILKNRAKAMRMSTEIGVHRYQQTL
jgi:hypothetical protein